MVCTQIDILKVAFTGLQYDPNPRVRDSMTAIWRALVAEPRKAVDEHYNAIMKELLKVRGAVPVGLCATANQFQDCRDHLQYVIHRLVTAQPFACGFLMQREGDGCNLLRIVT